MSLSELNLKRQSIVRYSRYEHWLLHWTRVQHWGHAQAVVGEVAADAELLAFQCPQLTAIFPCGVAQRLEIIDQGDFPAGSPYPESWLLKGLLLPANRWLPYHLIGCSVAPFAFNLFSLQTLSALKVVAVIVLRVGSWCDRCWQ